MFNLVFDFVFFSLVIVMLFVHFAEYRNNLSSGRWMSASKINLWLVLGYIWFLNYLYFVLKSNMTIMENMIGALGSLFFAAVIIFGCYPKMTKVSRRFFVERFSLILVLGVLSIALPYGVFMIVILGGFVTVGLEIYRLKKRKTD